MHVSTKVKVITDVVFSFILKLDNIYIENLRSIIVILSGPPVENGLYKIDYYYINKCCHG